jgi:hypothetical protein
MVVTHGQITDLEETKEVIVDLAEYACSLVVVGVGAGPFTDMHCLDADKETIVDSKGRKCRRDMV